jgi:hypothetical protein
MEEHDAEDAVNSNEKDKKKCSDRKAATPRCAVGLPKQALRVLHFLGSERLVGRLVPGHHAAEKKITLEALL